ncbi:MAG: hypothetical protein DCC71_18510, partial [Proteobacteria bacterium]
MPVGVAAALAVKGATPLAIAAGGLAAGIVVAALASWIARRSDEPDRGGALAAAASTGWLGAPCAAAAFF